MSALVMEWQRGDELAARTLALVGAAARLSDNIDVILISAAPSMAAKQIARLVGVSQVYELIVPNLAPPLYSELASILLPYCRRSRYCLMAAQRLGQLLLAKLASGLDAQMISNVHAIDLVPRFYRHQYAGQVLTCVEPAPAEQTPLFLSVQEQFFAPAKGRAYEAPMTQHWPTVALNRVKLLAHTPFAQQGIALEQAKVVVAVGQGVHSKGLFELAVQLASKLEASLAASRAIVDRQWLGYECQVGQTGKVIAPDLYIALGISGSAQHLAGISGAKTVLAINHDAHAPIFARADYGMVADLNAVLPQWLAKLNQLQSP